MSNDIEVLQNNVVMNYSQSTNNDYLTRVNTLKSELSNEKFANEYGI